MAEMRLLSVTELAAWLADQSRPQPLLLDVREPWEVALCALPGSTVIPMAQIPARIEELDDEREIVCICHHGMRSRQVAMFLLQHGKTQVFNLSGGVHAWGQTIDSTMAQY